MLNLGEMHMLKRVWLLKTAEGMSEIFFSFLFPFQNLETGLKFQKILEYF